MKQKQTASTVDMTTATVQPAMRPLAANELGRVSGGGQVGSGGTGGPMSVGGIGGSGKH